MKFTVDRDALAPSLGRAAHLATDKSTIPILSAVRVEASGDGLDIQATDLDQYLREQVDSVPREPGALCVDAGKLSVFVASLAPGPVTFTAENNSVIVSGGRSRARLAAFPVADFPVFSKLGDGAMRFEIEAAALARALTFTRPCISTEEVRRYLCGCYLHERDGFITAATSDGHRLAVCRAAKGPPIRPVIVPTATVEHVLELLRRATGSVACAVAANKIEFGIGDVTLTSKLMDGDFPAYERFIAPRINAPVVVNHADLLASAKRVAFVFEQRGTGRGMRLRSTATALCLSAGEAGAAADIADEIDQLAGPEVEVGANQRYLVAALTALDDAERVELHIADAASPFASAARARRTTASPSCR